MKRPIVTDTATIMLVIILNIVLRTRTDILAILTLGATAALVQSSPKRNRGLFKRISKVDPDRFNEVIFEVHSKSANKSRAISFLLCCLPISILVFNLNSLGISYGRMALPVSVPILYIVLSSLGVVTNLFSFNVDSRPINKEGK